MLDEQEDPLIAEIREKMDHFFSTATDEEFWAALKDAAGPDGVYCRRPSIVCVSEEAAEK